MSKIKSFFYYNSWIIILDILAVNVAYFGALLIRFYANYHIPNNLRLYLSLFYKITPIYTVLAIVVFFLFRLYNGMWIYAGLNDMNRIIMANLVTSIVQIVSSILIVGRRMPISYYAIGGFLQFLFVAGNRFLYRFIKMEKKKIEKSKEATIPALVIGSGDYGRKVIHHLDQNTPFHTVVIAGNAIGRNMDGIPVVSLNEIEEQIRTKDVKAVFIADDTLTKEQREAVRKAAGDLEITDYTGYFSNLSGFIPVTRLLEVAVGPVTLVVDGKETQFTTAREAQKSLTQRYKVNSISSPRIELENGKTDDSWVTEYQNETGEDVSFF